MDEQSVVALSEEDVPRCLELSVAAGWNQTFEDWQFQLALGQGIGIRTQEGLLIATGVILPAGKDQGWIAMVLVDVAWRRRGVGTAVMQTLISRSDRMRLALDATEQGKGVYERFGFRALEKIVRFRLHRGGTAGRIAAADAGVEGLASLPFAGISGALARRPDITCLASDSATGLVRPGRTSIHVGPIVAASEMHASALVASLLRESEGDILIDVPARLGTFVRRIERLGFRDERVFVRMAKGGAYFVPPGSFAIAGPEYG